ncbi:GntR family transcriptional regulator [Streptomyces sp. NPDC060223]|uniref:GntR family transcriptional regulator n=1 Tax=unclassified Streptomyces TaxID=2593676 RepID=UPI00362583E6
MNTTPEDTLAPIAADHHEPLWVQAVAVIEQRVKDGSLPAGRRLPAERELCAQLGISRVTLRRALRDLVDKGVLSSSHGRGWYVAERGGTDREWPNFLESFSETARRKGLTPSSLVLSADVSPATLDEGDEFGVAAGTELFRLDRVRLLDGLPIGVDSSRVPLNLAPSLGGTDFAHASMLDELTAAGSEPLNAESMVESRGCPADLAPHLDMAPGEPVLVMESAMTDAKGRVVLITTITYRGDRYRLRTSFARGGSA